MIWDQIYACKYTDSQLGNDNILCPAAKTAQNAVLDRKIYETVCVCVCKNHFVRDTEWQQKGKLKRRVCVQKLCDLFQTWHVQACVCVCVCQIVNGEKHPTDNTLPKALWAYCKALWVKQTIVTLQLIGGLQLALIHAPRGQSVRYLRT